ncbi:ABC transporter ATP-binding protein [Consotaella aegiceratis]|uniref:ABC transporter ATP-binding protein n=1 Tax=Consotaella aegiceratis TaxID=3097961 RepID=UPI002F40EAE4
MILGSNSGSHARLNATARGWWRRIRPYRWRLLALVSCQLGQVAASLLLPALSADVVDEGIVAGKPDVIVHYSVLMGVAAIVQVVLSASAVIVGATVAYRVGWDLRSEVFAKVHALAATQVRSFTVDSLITRCTNDVLQVQTMLTMALTMIIIAPIIGVGAAVMAVRQDAQLSLLLLVVVPILAAIIATLTFRATPLFRRMQKQIDRVNAVLREQISGIRVIRAFLQQRREAARFATANTNLTHTATAAGRLMSMIAPTVMMIVQLTSVALIWVGSSRVPSGDLQVGTLIAFLSYVALILISVMMMGMLIVMLPRALVSGQRIGELLRVPVALAPPASPTPLPAADRGPSLRFETVSFGYPGAEAMVLETVSFDVGPGQVLGIIGATGSGKSTIVNLIPRLDDPSEGRVTLGGVDLRALSPETLSAHIGYVPQTSYLLSGTVAETLSLGKPEASEDDLWHALEIAQAADFVEALPDRLRAPVSQGGSNFSGGQRQRLAIARALVCRSSIYVFDDSFSALDQATDGRLRVALRRDLKDAALVIVSQRAVSIRDADTILVLDKGRVVGRGRHEVLMHGCPVYADIVTSQQSHEGLAV